MLHFVKLIRLPNLIMMALAQFMVRYCIIIPLFTWSAKINPEIRVEQMLHTGRTDFILLVLSTVLVAAAGYIINDYFDTGMDSVNRPGKMIVGKHLSKSAAMNSYIALSASGVLLGGWVAWHTGMFRLGMINILTAGLLWFYSVDYKKTFLLGNVIIAFLSAVVPVVPALYEKEFYINFWYVLVYAVFAFLLTMAREVIKDVEDMEGDRMEGCRTIPIVLGTGPAKMIAAAFALMAMIFTGIVLHRNFYHNQFMGFSSLIVIACLPFAGLIYLIFSSGTKKEIHFVSSYIRMLMLAGIMTMPLLWFLILK